MSVTTEFLSELSRQQRELFQSRQAILSFGAYLDLVQNNPRYLIRNSPSYMFDMFGYFGMTSEMQNYGASVRHFNLFDHKSERSGPIIGGEIVQEDLYSCLSGFVRQGLSNKLVLLHGPNGSSKSCTVARIGAGLSEYSATDDGAVYRFNWIFPADRGVDLKSSGESGPIGFGGRSDEGGPSDSSFANLDESKISSKIHSEFKDNPIYLIPLPEREIILRKWIGAAENKKPEDVEVPQHMLYSGLSKKNQLIFENLVAGYDGDLSKVYRHVQIERFYYSSQYRVGIATVEPKMAVDAIEQQLTMDKNLANLPTVLQNIRFHEAHGALVEANRGLLEFSDMLKRPVEAFKYLLSTVEKGVIDMPSSTATLDLVFFGTTNEKHLDAFKTMPDFSSFRSRFHLVKVPYLLVPSKEMEIYQDDVKAIQKDTVIAPHSLELLCTWAVMTRLKQPDPEQYPAKLRGVIAKLDPVMKVDLYENRSLKGKIKADDEEVLRGIRGKIMTESRGFVVYEGRFGASPREVKSILFKAAQNQNHKTLTPMAIFEELASLVKDRTVYEFLQFEPRGRYHDAASFIENIKEKFADKFEQEVLSAMTLVTDNEYETLLKRYVDNVVAFVKKEKILNDATGSHEFASETLMTEMEEILGFTGAKERHREDVLGRIAAYSLDNKAMQIKIGTVFEDYLQKVQAHYHNQKRAIVDEVLDSMLKIDSDQENSVSQEQKLTANEAYQELENRFGYDRHSAHQCVRFLIQYRKSIAAKP